jgi:hypothetical protein
MPSYDDRRQAQEILRQRGLAHLRHNPDLAFQVAEAAIDEYFVSPKPADAEQSQKHRALLPGPWVIRNDDLKVIDSVSEVVDRLATAAAAGNIVHPMAAFLPCIRPVIKLFTALATKRAALHLDQRQVVVAMKALGRPASAEEIATFVDIGDAETVSSVLNELKAVHCVDGTVIAVAACGANGLWTTSGV